MSTTVPGTGHAQQQDIGFYTKRVIAVPVTSQLTNAAIVGAGVNRCDPNVALSVTVAVPTRFVGASGHSVSVARKVEHSDALASGYTEYGDQPDPVVITANNDGSAVDVDCGFAVDLSGAKPYVRTTVRPTLSASGVDTVKVGGTYVFAGFDTNPAG